MSKKVTTHSPKLFIGMDIHKRSWKVHFSTDVTIGSGKTMPPDPDGLHQYVKKYYPGHQTSIADEVGCCGYTAARSFETFSWDTYVVNPADIPRPSKSAIVKTDKIDAKNIARQLKSGNLVKLAIPDVPRECLRSLTRQRTSLAKDFRRIKCRIKALMLYYGIEIPEKFDTPTWPLAFLRWLKDFKWNYDTVDQTLKSMLCQYQFIDLQIKDVSTRIRAYCRRHYKKDYYLLRSVPGIGPITAANIISELGDLRRFQSLKKLAGYIGIAPGMYCSGDNEKFTGATPRANRTIRSLIVEASWVAIRQDPVLQQYYRKHAGKDSKAAIFKVSRKLLSRIHAVIKSEITYEIGIVQ